MTATPTVTATRDGDGDADGHRDADGHGRRRPRPRPRRDDRDADGRDADATRTATPTETATPTTTATPTATPTANLPLRDATTGIFHASTDQTLTQDEYGAAVTAVPLTPDGGGDADVAFYSAPLTSDGPALTTDDTARAAVWIGNPGNDPITVTCAAAYSDYDATTGTEVPFVATTVSGQVVDCGDRRRAVHDAGDESAGGHDGAERASLEADADDPLRGRGVGAARVQRGGGRSG